MGLAQAYDLDRAVDDLAPEVQDYQGIRVFYALQDNRFQGPRRLARVYAPDGACRLLRVPLTEISPSSSTYRLKVKMFHYKKKFQR